MLGSWRLATSRRRHFRVTAGLSGSSLVVSGVCWRDTFRRLRWTMKTRRMTRIRRRKMTERMTPAMMPALSALVSCNAMIML